MTLPAPAPTAAPDSHRWTSWNLHLASNAQSLLDRVVTEVVGPVAGSHPWFFIRYWQGGPHVRLRMADLDEAALERVEDELTRRLGTAGRLAADEEPLSEAAYRADATRFAASERGVDRNVQGLRAPGVHRAVYEPESERYGGAHLMPSTEELFQLSSELVLALMPHISTPASRSVIALRATIAAAAALGDTREQAAFYANSTAAWRAWAAESGCPPEQIDALCRVEGGTAPTRTTDPEQHGPFQGWHTALAGLAGEISRTTPVHPGQILFSHVHMFHNRLGRSLFDELRTYAWLAHHFPAAADGSGDAG
ncbi:thiopeptide-type bacteriocin biosynthesis protein [Streptomyces sp. NPDC014734]|uniref:thiopeptide-type bacteriocin biosynthesis protein n=1 Tax=Streptomyces sp. NPDC014734 TaxID=3364886 RepID=UPI0036FBC6F9